MIFADPQTWDALIAADKKFAKYRTLPIENYDKLQALFDGRIATGRYASSSTDPVARGPSPGPQMITPKHPEEDPDLIDEPMQYDEPIDITDENVRSTRNPS